MADTTDYLTDLKNLLDTNWRSSGGYIAKPTLIIRETSKTFYRNLKNTPFIMLHPYKIKSKENIGNSIVMMLINIKCEICIKTSGTAATDKLKLQNYYNEVNYILENFTLSNNGEKDNETADDFELMSEFENKNKRYHGAIFSINVLILRDYSS